MDWAGFEPAIFRLRIEHSYQAEPPAPIHWCLIPDYGIYVSLFPSSIRDKDRGSPHLLQ